MVILIKKGTISKILNFFSTFKYLKNTFSPAPDSKINLAPGDGKGTWYIWANKDSRSLA